MKKLVVFGLTSLLVMFAGTNKVLADGSTANVTVSKTVLNPQTNTYVKTLTLSDGSYHPGDTVVFHITLANTSTQTIQQIIVKDTFPQYLTFVSGVGSYDQKNKILSFLAYNLKPNTTQSFAISTQVVSADQFSTNQRQLCLMNKANILFGQNQTAQDFAQFCIAIPSQTGSTQPTPKPLPSQPTANQQVYPPVSTQTSPSTGVPNWILPGLLALAGLGFGTVRRSNQYIK